MSFLKRSSQVTGINNFFLKSIFFSFFLISYFSVLDARQSRTAFYEITLVSPSVCLSVRTSVRPSLNFLKIESLVFSNILCDYSWPWYLVTDEAQFLKKEVGSLNMDSMDLNQAQNEVFHHFLGFGSYVFLEIAYNNSVRQCLTSSRSKVHENNFKAQIWVKQVKIGPEIRFFVIFSSLVY